MSESATPQKSVRKIGCTRSIQTAVLVCEYLKEFCAHPHSPIGREAIRYAFTGPTDRNGGWSADILVEVYGEYDPKKDITTNEMVPICRAFVAGRGEIW